MHTPCALSRALARSLPYSLAANRFKISAAVADVRCPRSDRGAQREKDPRVERRVDRARDRSIGSSARSPKCPFFSSTGKTSFDGAHTCSYEAKDGRGGYPFIQSIDRSIDLQSSASLRANLWHLPSTREREKHRKSGRVRNGNAR